MPPNTPVPTSPELIAPVQPVINTPQPRLPFIPLVAVVILLILGAALYLFIQRKNNPQTPTPPKTSSAIPAIKDKSLNCPLGSSCKDLGTYKDSSFSATLKSGTSLLAAFDGTAEGFTLSHFDASNKRENYTLLSLSNQKEGLQAMYYLKGTTIQKKEVKAGEVVATSNGQPIKFLEGKSFVFIIIPSNPKDKLRAFSAASFK